MEDFETKAIRLREELELYLRQYPDEEDNETNYREDLRCIKMEKPDEVGYEAIEGTKLPNVKQEIEVQTRPIKIEKQDTYQIPSRVPSAPSKTSKADKSLQNKACSSKRNHKTDTAHGSTEPSNKKRKSTSTENQTSPKKPTSKSKKVQQREEYKKKFTDEVLKQDEIKSEINDSIANEWSNILKSGLPETSKESLMKTQTIPANCPLLKAPTLNTEILTFLNRKHVIKRTDAARADKQNQLGLGMAVVGKGLSLLAEDGINRDIVIKASGFIHQGCKILADLHYSETVARREALNLKPPMSALLQQQRDDTLLSRAASRWHEVESAILNGSHFI